MSVRPTILVQTSPPRDAPPPDHPARLPLRAAQLRLLLEEPLTRPLGSFQALSAQAPAWCSEATPTTRHAAALPLTAADARGVPAPEPTAGRTRPRGRSGLERLAPLERTYDPRASAGAAPQRAHDPRASAERLALRASAAAHVARAAAAQGTRVPPLSSRAHSTTRVARPAGIDRTRTASFSKPWHSTARVVQPRGSRQNPARQPALAAWAWPLSLAMSSLCLAYAITTHAVSQAAAPATANAITAHARVSDSELRKRPEAPIPATLDADSRALVPPEAPRAEASAPQQRRATTHALSRAAALRPAPQP